MVVLDEFAIEEYGAELTEGLNKILAQLPQVCLFYGNVASTM